MLWGFGSLHGAMTLLKRPAEAPFCALGVDFRMTHGPMTGLAAPTRFATADSTNFEPCLGLFPCLGSRLTQLHVALRQLFVESRQPQTGETFCCRLSVQADSSNYIESTRQCPLAASGCFQSKRVLDIPLQVPHWLLAGELVTGPRIRSVPKSTGG